MLMLFTATILTPTLLCSATLQMDKNNTNKNLAVFYSHTGNMEKIYNTFIEEKLQHIGFNVSNPHKRVNDQYEKQYGSTVLDVLSFMPIVNDSAILPLLNIDPRIAGFAPFNMLIYKKLDENITYIGHLLPEVMLDILDIKNEEVRNTFSSTFKALDETTTQEIGGNISYLQYHTLPKQTMIHYAYEFQAPEDLDEFISEFQNTFELAFINKGYLIAGFHDFMDAADDAEDILSRYDAFWTYSLCHLEFSYNMFDTQGARPEAGIFAPCTIYMYIPKGTNKIVLGMYRLQNWSHTLHITNKKRLRLIKKLDTQIPTILENLGMKTIPNANPLLKPNNDIPSKDSSMQHIKVGNKMLNIQIPEVPTVPEPKKPSISTFISNRGTNFSKHIPKNYQSSSTNIGEIHQGKISAYLRTNFLDVPTVKEKLNTAGFHVLSVYPVNKQEDLISIVFSNEALVEIASKSKRGFMASLRILIDKKDQKLSITNPLYIAKGFLQEDLNEDKIKNILSQLITEFPHLKNSKDALPYQDLAQYQFMKGMPKYEDMIEVASGDDLLQKVKNNKNVVFTQTLGNGAILIGIKLGKRTRQFTKRIGRNNAALLPYPILIEEGKAKILDPKYYISYMYPMLSMTEFMTIATIPDAIIKDCEKIFKTP